jgi:glycerol-3-phosphate dehydrogenase (NAD(P)+)
VLFKQAVLVIGAGSWGTALALVLAKNGHHVLLWSRNSDHVHQMQTSRQNARFLADIRFPVNLQPIASLETWIPQIQDIIIVVPSQGFREILHKIVPHLTETARLCWATKGLEYQSGLLLHQVAEQVVGTHHPLAVLTGPSFAKEVAMGLPTAVTVASFTEDHAQAIVALFHNNNFRPYTTLDLVGAQLGGAVKKHYCDCRWCSRWIGFWRKYPFCINHAGFIRDGSLWSRFRWTTRYFYGIGRIRGFSLNVYR